MSNRIVATDVATNKLIQVIETGERSSQGLSKLQALAALRARRSPKKREVFQAILAKREELPRFKHIAVRGLLELGGTRAEEALLESAQVADNTVAATMAEALGRVGSADSLPALKRLAQAASTAKERAAFAVSLLAYRHNLPGSEVKTLRSNQLMQLDDGTEDLPIRIQEARASEVELALASIKREPIGVELTAQNAQQMVCGPNTFILLWNKQFAGRRLRVLGERKGVAAVLCLKSRFEKDYFFSAFVLATPSRGRINLSVIKSSGEAIFFGSATSGSQPVLKLQSVKRPGGSAMRFEGSLREGRLAIDEARSAQRVQARRVAQADPQFGFVSG